MRYFLMNIAIHTTQEFSVHGEENKCTKGLTMYPYKIRYLAMTIGEKRINS